MDTGNGLRNAGRNQNNLDYSKAELTYKNITLPQTIFTAKWEEGKGYSAGIASTKLTEDYETLNEALEVIGLEMEVDKDGDEILKKKGDIDYDLIARITAVLITQFNEMGINSKEL